MKLVCLAVRKTRLLIAGVLLFVCISIALHDHICYKEGRLEMLAAVYSSETEEGKVEGD